MNLFLITMLAIFLIEVGGKMRLLLDDKYPRTTVTASGSQDFLGMLIYAGMAFWVGFLLWGSA